MIQLFKNGKFISFSNSEYLEHILYLKESDKLTKLIEDKEIDLFTSRRTGIYKITTGMNFNYVIQQCDIPLGKKLVTLKEYEEVMKTELGRILYEE